MQAQTKWEKYSLFVLFLFEKARDSWLDCSLIISILNNLPGISHITDFSWSSNLCSTWFHSTWEAMWQKQLRENELESCKH